jgi:hypothetical protein
VRWLLRCLASGLWRCRAIEPVLDDVTRVVAQDGSNVAFGSCLGSVSGVEIAETETTYALPARGDRAPTFAPEKRV